MGKPKIRFEGYTDDWEQRKLGDILISLQNNTLSRADLSNEAGVAKNVHYGDVLIKFGEVLDVSKEKLPMISDESVLSKYKSSFLQNGDVIVADTAEDSTVGKCSEIAGLNDVVVLSGLHTIPYRPIEKFASGYLGYYLNSSAYHNQLLPLMQGIKVTSISKSAMQDTDIVYPKSVEEQGKIGDYFQSLDHLITLHQRKCDETQKLKKYMLQKMFPQNGKKVPEIRFSGFTDDWEQRKLGDVIEKLTGGASIAPDDYVDVGYRTIPKGAVNSSGVADMSGCKNVSENFFKKNISSKTSSGELVTSLRDLVPTAPNMGRIVRICGETEDFLMPQGVYSIIVKEKISEDFLITYSNSPEYRKIIMAEKNGSTQVHIRNGEFLNIDIPLPSYEEQMKIGEHFKTLDHLITLHQRKCDELRIIKKFMLQNMFV